MQYGPRTIHGVVETVAGSTPIDMPLTGRVWDGNLWGITFAALPLRVGGTYTLPFWQHDKGFGTFTARVVGSEIVDTPAGKTAAWIVDAGDDPAQLDTALRRQRARNSATLPGTTLNGLAARACKAGLGTAIETAGPTSQGIEKRESSAAMCQS